MGVNSSHIITSIQCPIQPTAVRIIHHFQGLTLDYLTFDPNGVQHHVYAYTTLFRVRKKENLFLLAPLIDANFKVDKCVLDEM